MRKDPLAEPTVDADIRLIDVALPWFRQDARGNPLPETDWRFHITLPNGTETTFYASATAEDIAEALIEHDRAQVKEIRPGGALDPHRICRAERDELRDEIDQLKDEICRLKEGGK